MSKLILLGTLIGVLLGFLLFSIGISGINYLRNPTGTGCGMCLEILCDLKYGADNWILVIEKGCNGVFHMFETCCWCKERGE